MALDVMVSVGLCLGVVLQRFEACVCGEVGSCRLLDRVVVGFVGVCLRGCVRLASMHLVHGQSVN